MQKFVIFLYIFAAFYAHTDGKIFTRCELARELRRQGFPESQLREWVCVVERESSRNTAAVSPLNSKGHRYYGLFQIGSEDWCSTTATAGKGCNVTCKQMVTDNITAVSTCAKRIYSRQGWSAWSTYNKYCRSNLPVISNC